MFSKSTKKIRDLSVRSSGLSKSAMKMTASALIFMIMFSFNALAQTSKGTIKGKVTSQSDETGVPGASILVKGTTVGTTTDINGNFSVEAGQDDVLVISYIGYATEEVKIGNQTVINVSLVEDIGKLNEVIVIGYGTQKKALNTGANLQVNGESLQKQSQTNALQALQGQAPGVQISSTSGQPGEGMRVNIRGLGTVGNSGPLYVVDGVITGDISYLNNSDIESITVLKDAASAAIYGSQSANGVVLIMTKTGKAGKKGQITFDSYIGVQNVSRKINLLDSRQYAAIMNEAALNSGRAPIFSNDSIAKMGSGTNWMDEMFVKNAKTQNYSIGASGGSETSVYSTSLSYLSQEGIVGGKDLSNYERYNFRINSDHKLYKNIVRIGENLSFAYVKNNGIGVGNQWNNSLRSAFGTSPFLPMYDTAGNYYNSTNSKWNNTEANPYATMVYGNQNRRNNQKLLGNVYLELEPIKALKFKTSLGIDYFTNESHSFSPVYRLSMYAFNDVTKAFQSQAKGATIMWDNLLSYSFNLAQNHRFDLMVGSSQYRYNGTYINGSNTNLIFSDLAHAYLGNATNSVGTNMSIKGGADAEDLRLSYFGRLSYNYKETYLLNATFRRDGSSKFAKGNRWGSFPSISAGWVITNESFLESAKSVLSSLKLRASWGQVGNQDIGYWQYLAPVASTNTYYTFGPTEGVQVPGAYVERLKNDKVKWETSEQTNIGFDAQFVNSKLSVTLDWYNKLTRDWLIAAPILATAGAKEPFINGGSVRNRGFELGLAYKDRIGALDFTLGVNGAYNKNVVGAIPNADGIIHGLNNQIYANSGEFYRAENGQPIGYFWGLKTAGIFQNEAEVNDYKSGEGKLIQPNAQPGDVKYVDQNKDGVINDADRTNIGNPNPDFTFGFNIALGYKGFDLSVLASGVAGNQLVQSYRSPGQYGNYTNAILDRWHGEGTSNTMPRVTEDSRNWANFSDLYIHNGDYLRINNVTLGYDFSKLSGNRFLSQVRLYVSALNLYTFTKYDGMDPEIGFGVDNVRDNKTQFSQGIDVGYYPRPRTYLVGLNVKF